MSGIDRAELNTDSDFLCYGRRYLDLHSAFGANVSLLRRHWLDLGQNEGRKLGWCLLPGGESANATLTVTSGAWRTLSPDLHAAFLESEINFGGEGGLYAELIHNRDFEALGRGRLVERGVGLQAFYDVGTGRATAAPVAAGLDPHEPEAVHSDFRPWRVVGQAIAAIDNSTAPFATNPNTLRLQGAAGDGVANPGFWGIGTREHVGFALALHARHRARQASVRLMARVVAEGVVLTQAELLLPPSPDEWHRVDAVLGPPARVPSTGRARFELLLLQTSEVWIDGVSLKPIDAVAGTFRRDIVEMIAALQPSFIRLPGGNYLGGHGPRTRWDWKATLGRPEARRGHYNSAWGYWVTDGMGLYELLLLCKILGAEPQVSVYTGYSMGGSYPDASESARFVRDALDLLEFANGDAHASSFGRARAAMGRAEPFALRRLEVGNEEHDMQGYARSYKAISDAVWLRDPSVHIVASGRWHSEASIRGNPCLAGLRCDAWDEHFYRTPDDLALLTSAYDAYNRSWPKVYVGEFAANAPVEGVALRSLRAAVAEAAFMIGLERNADMVVASSFAPLLNNVHGTQWPYNLINFDATRLFGLPSYHVQRTFRLSLGAHTLRTSLSGGHAVWAATASAGRGAARRTIAIKLANYHYAPLRPAGRGEVARLGRPPRSECVGPHRRRPQCGKHARRSGARGAARDGGHVGAAWEHSYPATTAFLRRRRDPQAGPAPTAYHRSRAAAAGRRSAPWPEIR